MGGGEEGLEGEVFGFEGTDVADLSADVWCGKGVDDNLVAVTFHTATVAYGLENRF